jgi:three-Cys-motif partner protein
MLDQVAEPRTRYGGSWTIEKLEILERYLDAYTRALKNKSFNLMYIDAFAGTGYVEMIREDRTLRTSCEVPRQEQRMYVTSNSTGSFLLKATRVDARNWRL